VLARVLQRHGVGGKVDHLEALDDVVSGDVFAFVDLGLLFEVELREPRVRRKSGRCRL
jgi:hypothetical protein